MILSILLKHTPIQRFGQCRSKNGDLRIAQKCSCAEHDEVRFRVHSKICIPKHLRVGDYPHVVRMWVWGFPHLYQLRRFPSCCAMLCGGGESTASYLSQASLLRSASRTGKLFLPSLRFSRYGIGRLLRLSAGLLWPTPWRSVRFNYVLLHTAFCALESDG